MKKQFLPFPPEPFARLPLLCQSLAEGDCFRRGGQSKSSGELHAAQHTQGIFAKSIGNVTQNMASRSARPLKGSRSSRVSGSQAMAFMVKSRRASDSSRSVLGSDWLSNPGTEI